MQTKPTVTSQARRAQIVDAATAVIAREGLAKTSFSRIAAEAGLSSPGMISYHFADKDELFVVLCDALLADCAGTLDRAVEAAADPREALSAYLTAFVAWQDSHRDGVKALWRLSSGWVAPGQDAAFDEDALVEPLRRLLVAGSEQGVLRSTNVEWVVQTVLSAVEGFDAALKADPHIDADDFAEEMVRLFGQGLEVRHDGSDRGGAR